MMRTRCRDVHGAICLRDARHIAVARCLLPRRRPPPILMRFAMRAMLFERAAAAAFF